MSFGFSADVGRKECVEFLFLVVIIISMRVGWVVLG